MLNGEAKPEVDVWQEGFEEEESPDPEAFAADAGGPDNGQASRGCAQVVYPKGFSMRPIAGMAIVLALLSGGNTSLAEKQPPPAVTQQDIAKLQEHQEALAGVLDSSLAFQKSLSSQVNELQRQIVLQSERKGESWLLLLLGKVVEQIPTIVMAAITGLSLWLAHRQRLSSYQSVLYQEKLECYSKLVVASRHLIHSYMGLWSFYSLPTLSEDTELARKRNGKLKKDWRILSDLSTRCAIILPDKMQSILVELLTNLPAVDRRPCEGEHLEKRHDHMTKLHNQILSERYVPLLREMRRDLAIDSLSGNFLELAKAEIKFPESEQGKV